VARNDPALPRVPAIVARADAEVLVVREASAAAVDLAAEEAALVAVRAGKVVVVSAAAVAAVVVAPREANPRNIV